MKNYIREKLITKITQLELDMYHQSINSSIYTDEAKEAMTEAVSTDAIRERLEECSIKQLWIMLRVDLLRYKSNKLTEKFNKTFEEKEEDEEE